MAIELDGASLTVGAVALGADGATQVDLAEIARGRVAANHRAAVAITRPVYGRTTGVGGNRLVSLADTQRDSAGRQFDPAIALLRSHASSSGPLRSPERVRAMLIVRLNQLAAGGSGVNPVVLDGILEMINADALPPVRELSGVGTGDLAALATTALTLLGEVPASRPLSRVVRIGIGDALPLLSSNAATIGDAALAVGRLDVLARTSLLIAAATFAATSGNPEAFSSAVEDVTPFAGARWVCQTMRRLFDEKAAAPARIQDPFALRALPQVHGPLLDALASLNDIVTRLANTSAENPVYRGDDVVHHGGFHVAYLAQALDAARLALAQAAQLSLARLSMLCAPQLTELPPFLADGRPGASGVMVVEYVVASALGQLRSLATPAALQTVTLSNGVEEDASFASLAAQQTLLAIAPFRTVLAGELVAAVRALRMKGLAPPTLQVLLDAAAGLGSSLTDRDLTPDLQLAERLLDHDLARDANVGRLP